VADKLTQQITDALSKAAADPAGLPLYAGKSEVGLFPATAKPAAQKCLADGLVKAVGTETKGKTARERYALTEAGWERLLDAVNPKQVLEDFVRVLEARQGEVGELLTTARRMADSLQRLKDAAARVLPRVIATRIDDTISLNAESSERSAGAASRLRGLNGVHHMNGTAVLADPAADLAAGVLARLADWASSANAGEDCPLPELYRALSVLDPAPSIGAFHDVLRKLHAAGTVYLHPWTGPLYALPEPALALLVGHNVAYYASPRA
jgi:DNA-binding PadR family transcriptional regulator